MRFLVYIALLYLVYRTFFRPSKRLRHPNDNGPRQSSNSDRQKGEYIDYEEVE